MGSEAEGAHSNNVISVQTHISHLENNNNNNNINKAFSFFLPPLVCSPSLCGFDSETQKDEEERNDGAKGREEKSADWHSGLDKGLN